MDRLFIDVREPYEFSSGHVKGAINIPTSNLASARKILKDVPIDTEIIVYCQSGARAGMVMDTFEEMGFTKVTNGYTTSHIRMTYGI